MKKNINGRRIVIIKIFPGSRPPYFIKSEGNKKGVYLRSGSSTRRAEDEFIEDLYRHQKKTFFDEEVSDVPIESLEKSLLLDFYESKYKEENLILDKIAVRNLANPKKLFATNAALLFFTPNPEMYIPEAIIICTWFKGKEGRDIIKTMEQTGPIPTLVESTLKLLDSWLEIDFNLSSSGKLKGRSLVPLVAIREALVNALIHRKYIIRGAVKVAMFEDRLEIFSPGSLPRLMSLKNLGDGTTFLRNPTLAKMARKLRLIEKLGSGIRLIFDSCKKEKLKKPSFYEDGDFLKVVFYFEKELDEGLSVEEKILELGVSLGEIRIKDLISKVGVSRNTATRKMNILIAKKYSREKEKVQESFSNTKGKKMNKKIRIVRPKNDKMCDLGYHVVSGHYRVCGSGTKTWVDTHARRNRGKLIMHLSENLLFLYWNSFNKYQNIGGIKGYLAHNELDSIIQFWLDYWKQNGEKFPDGLTALHVKALIAVESSFNPSARPKTSSARGLMQILDTVRNALRGTSTAKKNEVRSNYIDVTAEQIEDPVVNIAVGTRWLAHKFFLLRNQKDKSLKKVLRNYYSKTFEGDEYSEKILDLYEKSK